MKRISILTYGSRGDVQPYVALGSGLLRAGYAVRLAAPHTFESFARGALLDFAPLPGDPAELVRIMVAANNSRGGRIGSMRAILGYAAPLAAEVFVRCREACADADLVIHSFLLTGAGHMMAAERGIPEIGAEPYPLFASTGAAPNMAFPELSLGASYNRLTHHLFNFLAWQGHRLGYQWARRRRPDLPPAAGWPFGGDHPSMLLFAVSPHVIAPVGWPEHVHFTGYWFLGAQDFEPPADLLAFLGAGPPPVYVGFGSMIAERVEEVGEAAVAALRRAGQRGLILRGWSGLGRAARGDDLHVIDGAPHDWLFPRMAAVLHHGGAGTTAAGLRAGVPSILTPFSSDQPFWGRRVHALGVGPRPIPYRRANADNLAAAIAQAVSDAGMRERAAKLGAAIRAEDGVAEAIKLITALR